MKALTQVQDKLMVTLKKCYRTNKAKGYFSHAWGHKSPAVRVATNKAERELESMGFTSHQAYLAVRDAVDMAKLEVECEA
jgi:superfamily I DNA and RNA helicase